MMPTENMTPAELEARAGDHDGSIRQESTSPFPHANSFLTERALLEAIYDRVNEIAAWQNDANALIRKLFEAVEEVKADPMKLFSGVFGA
jgi:hypothetical protein